MVQPGSILLGKYRIERILGKGGMGVVALAHHLQLDEPMAIKFLRPTVLGNATIVQRFLREAQAAVKLKNEHICRVFDVGTLETGSPYMVMEYLQGMDLGDFMRARGTPPLQLTVDILLQACHALSEAHGLGIVHRDVKPANFFVTRRADGSPLIKLLDFGISKAQNQVEMELTNTQSTLGTPAYMSPEQLRSSKNVDARTDIWALGVILYELLSGRRPFRADTFSALCIQVATEPVPTLDVPLPHGLDQVVMRCLQKDPDHRFQNVAELAAALEPYGQDAVPGPISLSHSAASMLGLQGAPTAATPAPDMRLVAAATPAAMQAPSSLQAPSTISDSSGQMAMAAVSMPAPPRRRRGPIFAGLAAVAVALVALALLVPPEGDDDGDGDGGDTTSARAHGARSTATPDNSSRSNPDQPAKPTSESPGTSVQPGSGTAPSPEPSLSRYTIASQPSGADVLENGERVGQTPFTVELEPGQERSFALTHDGYRERVVTLPEAAGDSERVELELLPRPTHAAAGSGRTKTDKSPPKASARPKAKTRPRTKKKKKKKRAVEKGETLGWE